MKEFKCCKMTFNFTAFLTIWLLVGVKSYENIDECELGLDNCDENTNCTNTVGSYICTCYCGDGRNCTVSDTSMGIRLVDGNETSGLVEVLRNCEWRSICDDYWTDEDAMVACGKLGFLPYAAGSYRRGIFRDGEEVQYWLDDVQCTGNEVSLFDCPHKDTHNCGRRERAGVHCLAPDPPCEERETRVLRNESYLGKRARVWCRFVGWVSGGLSVTMDGILMLQEFSAGNITCLLKTLL
ncbi:Deleted in malignant brain tumors 1 protein [Geodia barretti]|uniref:Deleted in malignant brain tumors 1 protein n=1 Tax=Geodia barretti TaxID=519541 RepID=A0AA35XLE1_GEOBA|nr:Deleted in malignant brain tumors 1 protein [Geodia barretti]